MLRLQWGDKFKWVVPQVENKGKRCYAKKNSWKLWS